MKQLMTLTAALTIGSCAALFAAEDEAKRVRFINGVPGGPAEISVGGKPTFKGVSYGSITEFKSVLGDDPKVELMGGRQAAQRVDLGAANENYTVLATPDPGGAGTKLHLFTTSRIDANNSRAQITLINASSDVKAADLLVGTAKVHAGVNPAGHNGPDLVDPGAVTLKVRDGSQDKDLTSRQMDLMAGKSYTVVVFSSTQVGFAEDAAGNLSQLAPMQPTATGTSSEMKGQDNTVPNEGATKPAER